MPHKELYERKDSLSRGRYLVSTEKIVKDRIVFNERPLLSLQSIGNAHDGALVCRCCRAFIGGPDLCLGIASGRLNRDELWTERKNEIRSVSLADTLKIVPCRNGCGELFCSKNCEDNLWNCCGHDLLCTGLIHDPELNTATEAEVETKTGMHGVTEKETDGENKDDSDRYNELHPLLQFKVHAVQNNEILLMIGDFIATVLSLYRKQLEEKTSKEPCADIQSPNLKDIMAPYLDFTMEPWWEVATAPLLNDPTKKTELLTLDRTLRNMCKTSAELLKRAMLSLVDPKYICSKDLDTSEKNPHVFASTLHQALKECEEKYDMFSELFFGQMIGSFEQNAMGVRARHPLCRDVLEMKSLRDRRHDDLVKCIERAGLIGSEDDDLDADRIFEETENLMESKDVASPLENNYNLSQIKIDEEDMKGSEYEYNLDDIAKFLAELHINEDGNEKFDHPEGYEEDQSDGGSESCGSCRRDGDDLDLLFSPLDGTAMYSTTCKMNHSCCPNIVAKYAFSCPSGGEGARWGGKFPMVIQCVALRDIEEGEELCLSYISNDQPFEQRQRSLANYGFECKCTLCLQERKTGSNTDSCTGPTHAIKGLEDDIFGEDGDGNDNEDFEDDLFGEESETDDDVAPVISNHDVEVNTSVDFGSVSLGRRVAKLDLLRRSSGSGGIPLRMLAPASSFVVQVGTHALQNINAKDQRMLKNAQTLTNAEIIRFSSMAINATKERNFATCIEMGYLGELSGFELLKEHGAWPDALHRELYECCVVAASIGFANNGSFLPALEMLDKGSIFGLPRERLKEFYSYVESHAYGCYHFHTSNFRMSHTILPDYRESSLQDQLRKEGLSSEIKFPIDEVDIKSFRLESFHKLYELAAKPVVIRNFAHSWPALQRWRNLNYFIKYHGNRVVPVERGIMSEEVGIKEDLMSIRDFVTTFLIPSNSRKIWPLELATSKTIDEVIAYLAQHHLFDQIPNLIDDIDSTPCLCGSSGPSHVNIWMGTGGTKTPLHYDSYDNLFVQIVGAKYVRLYSPDETDKLYVMSGEGPSYGKQGNMSAIDCEKEDFAGKHGDAKSAKFTEVLMLPGDLLFIPSKTWHYVRGLSTSISANFWW